MAEQMTPREAQMEIASLTLTRMEVPVVTHVALTALAADRLEYGITFADESTVYWVGDDRDTAEGLREAWINRGDTVGPMVCRRVSEPWEVTDE